LKDKTGIDVLRKFIGHVKRDIILNNVWVAEGQQKTGLRGQIPIPYLSFNIGRDIIGKSWNPYDSTGFYNNFCPCLWINGLF